MKLLGWRMEISPLLVFAMSLKYALETEFMDNDFAFVREKTDKVDTISKFLALPKKGSSLDGVSLLHVYESFCCLSLFCFLNYLAFFFLFI